MSGRERGSYPSTRFQILLLFSTRWSNFKPVCAKMASNKRKNFTVAEKAEILKQFREFHGTKVSFAKLQGIPVTTLQSILQKKECIKKNVEKVGEKNAKKRRTLKKSPYDELEVILVKWFKEARAANVPVNGTILREKALEIADRLVGLDDFTASNGWIDRMKKRHNLVYRSLSGESSSVDETTIEEWKKDLPNLTKGYKPKDVFNADETGLFFNLLPDKSYVVKGDSCHGGKMSKLRLTVLLCCNSDGSEKLTPLVVGKSRNPRCFKNVRSFPTKYEANKKAWITQALFEDFLRKLNKRMKLQNRKIILFIDRCSAHPDLQLSNVRVEFFPANCTSKLQPCDLGIIRSFKVFYKKQLVRKAVAELENGNLNDAYKLKLSVLEAMHFISASWRNVTQQCISRCFEESGFVASIEPGTDEESAAVDSENDNETVIYDFEDYIPENLVTCETERPTAPSVDDLMDFSSSDEDEQDETEANPVPSFNSALKSFQIVKDYFLSHKDQEKNLQSISILEDAAFTLNSMTKKQSIIEDYFQPKFQDSQLNMLK